MVPSLKNEGTISVCPKSPQNFKKKCGKSSIRFPPVIPLPINSQQNPLEKPNAYRAVANACGKNPKPIETPCHRVISSDGSIGGYSAKGGVRKKIALLKKEGIIFD